MPLAAILGLATAFLSLAKTLIEKFVPSKVTRKREFKSKKKAMDFCGKTQEQIRNIGINKGWIKEER